MTPSLENFVVRTWLRLTHSDLPNLVKQRYGTELRPQTLASLKPEISQALDSLLDEIHASVESKGLSTAFKLSTRLQTSIIPSSKLLRPSCPLCKEAGRRYKHYLSKCKFLPDSDRQFYIVRFAKLVNILNFLVRMKEWKKKTFLLTYAQIEVSAQNNHHI